MFSIILHGFGVEDNSSVGRYIIEWEQPEPTSETLREKVIQKQCARANHGILASDDPALNSTNTEKDLEMNDRVEQWKSHRMAKVYNFLEMWQGSQNLHPTQKESHD